MSIFKQTFQEHLQTQIVNRQNLLSYGGDKRPIQFQQYVSGKAPWVKMTSLVDYKESPSLAKNHILLGGTLYPNPNSTDEYRLRGGVYVRGGSYGSNLGDNKQYGIRPMPGITNVSIKSRGAYGSLRDATIKYYAWDLKQLENLVILFMKPGYPVVLEWGWSMYINNENQTTDNFNIVSSDFLTVDCFDPGLSQESLYEQFDVNNKKYKGNYEGMLGFIKNYEYSMLPNGGFECTTTLISIGDVIESLKMNVVTGIESPQNQTPIQQEAVDPNNPQTTSSGSVDVKDDFEILMDWISNTKDLRDTPGPYFGGITLPSNSNIDTRTIEFGTEPFSWFPYMPKNDDRSKKYIQFAYLIHILNDKNNIFLPQQKKLIKYEIPLPGIAENKGTGFCIASYNSVTIDTTVCILKNSSAKLIEPVSGFSPYGTSLNEYLYPGTNLGVVGNLYINIGCIIDTYKSISTRNKGRVTVAEFLRGILSRVEYVLGSVNNFDIYVENNRAIIIDKHYLEDPGKAQFSDKFELKVLGNNSTVRTHRVASRIFQDQSSMIAIAAQDRQNIGAYQSSTNVFMNKDIYNRLYKNSSDSNTVEVGSPDSEKEVDKNTYLKNTTILLSYITEYVLVGKKPDGFPVSMQALNTILNNLIVKLERGTDYKGIVPLALEVTMDGIGGVTIGEVFRINEEILPSQYRDKSVGFIVTGIEQDISRPDWITKITAQFCLLDQAKKQQEIKLVSDNLKTTLLKFSKDQKTIIEADVYYYNLLIAFIADFFKSSFNILVSFNDSNIIASALRYKPDASTPYYLRAVVNQFGGSEGEVLSEMANLSILGSNQNKFKYKKLTKEKESLSFYINDYKGDGPYTNPDYSENVVNYINYIVKESSYYKSIQTEKIKARFDGVFKTVLYAYKNQPTTFWKSIATSDIIVAELKSLFTLGYYDPQEAIVEAMSYIESGEVKINYLNKNAYNDYGVLKIEKLQLEDKLTVTFSSDLDVKVNVKELQYKNYTPG